MAGNLPQSGVSLVAQNAGQFVSQMSAADKALGAFGKGAGAMSQIVTGALRQVGVLITNMAAQAAAAVGRWLVDSIGVAGDFEQTLNVLGATSGATAAELDAVARKAKELGADMQLPATSAQDAAEVMLELSKAGLSVQESMDAAKGALQLSAAAQVDAATAASITAGALNAFGLEASEAARIADLLAAGANASSASMTDLSQGLQQAGFAFNAAGLPVEDLVTSLAALTNVGLTGSDAGTALKNALMRLMDPTDKAAGLMAELGFNAFDANGKMKPLPQLIDELNIAFAGMTDQQRNAALGNIFLSDGMKAMIPLLDLGSDGFLKLKDSVTQEGAAAQVANAQMQGWNGGLQALGSQMETLQLIVGTFLKDALTPLLFLVAQVVSEITAFADAMFSSADPANFLIAAIDSVLPGFAQMAQAIGRVVAILFGDVPSAGSIATTALTGLRDTLVNVVIPAVTQIANWLAVNLPAAIAQAKAAFADIQAFIATNMPIIQNIITTALQIIQTFWQQHGDNVITMLQGAWEVIKGIITTALALIQGTLVLILGIMTGDWDTAMAQITQSNQTMAQAGEVIWNGILDFLTGVLNAIATLFGTSISGIVSTWRYNWETAQAIVSTVLGNVRSTIDSVMNAAASIVAEKVSAIKGAFSGIIGVIDSVISAAKRLASALASIDVPDILSPGSPTPFEIGLRGVDKALKQTTRTLEAQFAPAIGGMIAALPPMQAGSTTSTTYGPTYQMPIYTNQSPAALSQSLALVEALVT